jgi:hypothetical protein
MTPSNAPVTRNGTRWAVVSTTPAGTTAFCRASDWKIWSVVTPSVASLALENSTKIFSSV